MEKERAFFSLGSTEDQLSRNSLEATKRKHKNQLHNLALSGKWKKSTTNASESPVNPDVAKENESNTKKTGFFHKIADIRSTLKEEREMLEKSNILFEQEAQMQHNSGNKMQKNMDDSEENDSASESKEKTYTVTRNSIPHVLSNDSARSKASSLQSYRENFLENSAAWFKRTSSPIALRTDRALPSYTDLTREPSNVNDLNFIMLLGLFVGLLVSKILKYLQTHIRWLLSQLVQSRNAFLGITNMWEFLNLDDNTNHRVQTKLMLMPVIGIGGLIYGLAWILQFVIRFLLTAAPNGLINFVQRLRDI
uniref:Uncharacterized protein n=1 Tax=Glossina brevipalpis TaxID=37001 RepID=A0A1A9X476_9MUSC